MADHSRKRGTSQEAGPVRLLGTQAREAVDYVRRRTRRSPQVGIILGSGLGSVSDEVSAPDVVHYVDIPHFPVATVDGHLGALLLGEIAGRAVAVMAGRPHFYEGYSMQQVAFPIRVLRGLGCQVLILTNAAGGINPDLRPADIMLIRDHINLPGMAGFSPLCGTHEPDLGPRFVSMDEAYDADLGLIATRVAARESLVLKRGVYAMVGGPAYETQAEVGFLRAVGADAIGMSTAPEAVVARQMEMRVLGLSCIANAVTPRGHPKLSHQEVLASIANVTPRLRVLLRGILGDLD